MDLYHIPLHAVLMQMKRQANGFDDGQRPDRKAPASERASIGSILRLKVSGTLFALARALDPANKAPSHQPGG